MRRVRCDRPGRDDGRFPVSHEPVVDEDEVALTMILVHFVPVVVGFVVVKVETAQVWLVERSILATSHLVVALPGGVGGLDAPRLLLAVGVLGLLVLGAAKSWRRRRNLRALRR